VQELRELAHSFDTATQQELRVLAYLAICMAGDIEAAYCALLASIEALFSWFRVDSATYSKVLLPFVEGYWVDAFQRERFRFRCPELVATELDAALRAEPRGRVVAILRAVLPAFRISGLESAADWLRRKSTSND
jgi:hypothetical protein